ncbi:Gfo/Idh/MocA family oxidoreductase [Paenibacillus sp. HWE-109]|uniref:Gfo/Idh/MocA family protein n=1 Tax=Paenibacillus sp. HWE-109 TaxID=1306526 RepID=UPI001EDF4D11|nr:Gfo/Idh/MocA family oxidoreductase [Paenibacillus sp. HWE-109]UKS26872.1 Gfo/Idh/MocA family oxidoreductase [Paenibacillus sp. HWE-109]
MSFRICIVGCGQMAEHGHGPAWREYADRNSGVTLAACCDIDEARAGSFQQKFGFSRRYTDIGTMLEREKPDAICLVVPAHLMTTMAIPLLEKGYPQLLEKPPGLNREETIRLIQAAERGDAPNQVAFNRRYMPLVLKLQEVLKLRGDSGIHTIRYVMYRTGRTDEDFATTAIHGIDLVSYIAGSAYRHIQFRYQELPDVGTRVANIYVTGELVSGAVIELCFCPVSGGCIERMEVSTWNHTFFLELPVWGSPDIPGRLLHSERNQGVTDISGNLAEGMDKLFAMNGFYEENCRFFDEIRAGRKPKGDIKSGLQAVEIADCIRNRKAEYRLDPYDGGCLT